MNKLGVHGVILHPYYLYSCPGRHGASIPLFSGRITHEGLTNKEIAAQLVVSLGTVKFHVSNIFQKLGVDSRVEAVKLAIEQKLV